MQGNCEKESKVTKKLKTSIFWFFLIGVIDVVFMILAASYIEFPPPSVLIMIIGVVTFFGMLAISNYYSEDEQLLKGEMRKAIASSLLMVYFAVVGLVLFGGERIETDVKFSTLQDFHTLMAVVIGFYFGGRSAEEVIKAWKSGSEVEPGED
jgi:hypothetical protein